MRRVKHVRSHYLVHSSKPRLSQPLQQLVEYHTSIHSDLVAHHCHDVHNESHIAEVTFIEITASINAERSHACPSGKEAKHASTHVSDISENPTDSGRARIVIEYYLPTSTASEAAMQACQGILTARCCLPRQGIVLTLLSLLPSPHRCIKRSASIWRGNDLFFLADLGIHGTGKLLFTRKH